MRNLVFLSTSVCGLHPAPIAPSASQWPKPLRSPASGGRSGMGARPGIGKRDVLPPPRPRRLLWPRGRQRAQRSRRWRSAWTQRQTVSGHTRMAESSGNRTRGLPPTGGGDQPRPGHSAARAHRRSHDGRVAPARFGAPAAGLAPPRGRRCSIRPSTGPSSAVSAGTAGRTRSRWTGTTCRVRSPCRPSRRCGRASDRSCGCWCRCRSRSG